MAEPAQKHHRQLIQQGFCKFDQVLEPAMLRRCQDACDQLLGLTDKEHFRQQKSTGSLVDVFEDQFFAELAAYRPGIECLEGMGYRDIRWQSGYVISKPPRSPPLFWHQDWWGWDDPSSYDEPPQQVFFMYYMVDTSRENGALRVLPESHRSAHAVHRLVPDAHTTELREMTDPDHPAYATAEGEQDLAVRAGDLLIGDARLLHAAHGNATDRPRPCITLWYHPDFGALTAPIRAHIMQRHPFPAAWKRLGETTLKGLAPDYQGDARPLQENRIARRFSMPVA